MTIKSDQPVVFHFRNKERMECGGITVVYNPKTHCFGLSLCKRSDGFWKRQGFKKAWGRTFSEQSHKEDLANEWSIQELKILAGQLACELQRKHNYRVITKTELFVSRALKKMKNNLLDVETNYVKFRKRPNTKGN